MNKLLKQGVDIESLNEASTPEATEPEQKVPPILYIANKAEDGFEGDILSDFYRKFP